MKAILIFDLPEDRHEHDMALHGLDWALVVLGMDTWLRNNLKYGNALRTVNEAIEEARQYLRELLDDNGVSLDDIP